MKRTRQAQVSKVNLVEDGEVETPAALLNDVVLQNIFKFLGYKDLKIIRDVKNSTWLRNSKKAWWSRTKVNLKKEKIEEYLNQTEINSCAKNYKLESFRVCVYKRILEHCGHSMKYLVLDYCKFGSVDEFRQLIYTKCPNLEKLVAPSVQIKSMTVAVEPTIWQEPQFGQQKNLKFLNLSFFFPIMPLSWMELLSHFPNLEGFETATNVDIYKVISIIRRHDPKRLKLKHIDIVGRDESGNGESFRLVLLDPNLSFETIHFGEETDQTDTLVDILELHAKSLKEIYFKCDVWGGHRSGLAPTPLPLRRCLLNLEKLTLSCSPFVADILRYTPNVRKVSINYFKAHYLQQRTDTNLRINTCKELSIAYSGQLRDSPNSELQFCLDTFPNVEILEISELDNVGFSMICERWTKLVSFTVRFDSQVNDFGLLGFDPKSKIESVRNPNITNLKDLQIFSMSSYIDWVGGLEMKNAQMVLRELEGLPNLKQFVLKSYKLKEEQIWNKIFAKYPVKL